MQILILGDSVPAQRPSVGLPIEYSWPVLLKSALPSAHIWYRARNRSTTREMLEEFNLFSDSLHFFKVITVQIGIVDSCPRPYPYAIQRFIWSFLGERMTRFTNRNAYKLLKVLPGRPWISKDHFRKNLTSLITKSLQGSKELRLQFIKIAPPRAHLLETLPNVTHYVEIYNEILHDVVHSAGTSVSLLDPYSGKDPSELIIEDGHHLTKSGHQAVADAVLNDLRKVSLI